MDFALTYLVYRFFYRVYDFFHHWYVSGSKMFAHKFIATLESADQTIAFRITLRYFFQPLYKDYTVIGRILGVVFRTIRLALGAAFYLFIIICFAIAYVVWVAIPAILIFYAIRNA